MSESTTVFDQTATDFASKTNTQIGSGRYWRGELFLSAVKASVKENAAVLDYGCGPGRISGILARSGYRVVGLDPSTAMIAVATQQPLDGLQVRFQLCETGTVDPQGGNYDAVVCSSVIEYVDQPEWLLKQFSSVLAPSGVLIISFANRRSLSRALFQHRNLHLSAQKHTWSGRQFHDLLELSGFCPVGSTIYFESYFDRFPLLRPLSNIPLVGGLGLVVATRR